MIRIEIEPVWRFHNRAVVSLESAQRAALGDEKVRKIFTDQAQEPAGGTAEQYAKLVREDSEKYARLVKELNVKVE